MNTLRYEIHNLHLASCILDIKTFKQTLETFLFEHAFSALQQFTHRWSLRCKAISDVQCAFLLYLSQKRLQQNSFEQHNVLFCFHRHFFKDTKLCKLQKVSSAIKVHHQTAVIFDSSALSQTSAKAARSQTQLVHRVVFLFTFQLQCLAMKTLESEISA